MKSITLLCGFSAFFLVLSVHVQALTLQETIKLTLRTNPEVLAASNELQSRKFEVVQARSGYLPTLSVDAGIGRETRKSPSTDNQVQDLDRQELGLQASQMVFDGFATSSEHKRQRARLLSAESALKDVSGQVSLRTAQAYLDVLRHSELLHLAQQTLWEHQSIYDQMKLRSEQGVGSKADLDQIAARLALANSNMIVAQNNYADTQASFHRMTGVYPNVDAMVKPVVTTQLPKDKDSAIALALNNHPVLSAAGADVQAAQAQHKAAKASYWPSVTLEAEKRWDENVGIAGEDEDTVVALRLRYDFYKGGATKARSKQTAFLIEEAKDIRSNSRRQVLESMSLSWNSHAALQSQRQFLEAHVRAAESTKTAYGKQFNIGRRTLLDLLNAETEVVESRRALINAEYDQIYAAYRIFNAAGQLPAALGADS